MEPLSELTKSYLEDSTDAAVIESAIQEAIEGHLYHKAAPEAPPLKEAVAELGEQLGEAPALPSALPATDTYFSGILSDSDNKLFAAIHEEYMLSGSALEGGQSLQAMLLMAQYFDTRNPKLAKKYEQGAELCHYLQQIASGKSTREAIHDLQLFVSLLKQKIEALPPGESLLVPMGWSSKVGGGHAMYLEIEPTADGKFDVWVYNSGAGIGGHHASRVEGGKLKYQLMVKLEGLDRAAMTDPLVLQALFEPRVVPPMRDAKTLYGEHDGHSIYEQTLRYLLVKGGGRIAELSVSLGGFATVQRSGSCVWSSLLPSVRKEMSAEEYQKFKHTIKQETLVDYWRRLPSPPTATQQLLVTKAIEKFARHTTKLFQRGHEVLTRAEALEAYAAVRLMAAKLKEINPLQPLPDLPLSADDLATGGFDSLFTAVTVVASNTMRVAQPGTNQLEWTDVEKKTQEQIQAVPSVIRPLLDWHNLDATIAELEALRDQANAIKASTSPLGFASNLEIQRCLLRMPLPLPQMTEAQAQRLAPLVIELTAFVARTGWSEGNPTRLLAVMSGYVAIGTWDQRVHPMYEILKLCPLDWTWWKATEDRLEMVFRDPELDARFSQLSKIIKQLRPDADGLFCRPNGQSDCYLYHPLEVSASRQAELLARRKAISVYPDGQKSLESALATALKDQSENMAKDPRVREYSPELWEAALLFADRSRSFFPDWFNQMESTTQFLSGIEDFRNRPIEPLVQGASPTLIVRDQAANRIRTLPLWSDTDGLPFTKAQLTGALRSHNDTHENYCALAYDSDEYLLNCLMNTAYTESWLPLLLNTWGSDYRKLRDARWQALFEMVLFRTFKAQPHLMNVSEDLATDLKAMPLLASRLAEFIREGLKFYRTAGFTEDLESGLFILRLSHALRPYLAPYVDLTALPNERQIMREWLERESDPAMTTLIAISLAMTYDREPTSMEKCETLLRAQALRKLNKLPTVPTTRCHLLERFDELVGTLQGDITKFVGDDRERCCRLFEAAVQVITPDYQADPKQLEIVPPFVRDSSYKVSLLGASPCGKHGFMAYMGDPTRDSEYAQLFGVERLFGELTGYWLHVHHPTRGELLIQRSHRVQPVFKKMPDGHWYKYLPIADAALPNGLDDLERAERKKVKESLQQVLMALPGHSVWVRADGARDKLEDVKELELLLCDNERFEPRYRVACDPQHLGTSQEVGSDLFILQTPGRVTSIDGQLELVRPQEAAVAWTPLTDFEIPQCMAAWKSTQDGQLSRIDLVRFVSTLKRPLRFLPHQTASGRQLRWEEDPRFTVIRNDKQPLPGIGVGYLLLMDELGHRKVLVPARPMEGLGDISSQTTRFSRATAFENEVGSADRRQVVSEQFEYLVFDIDHRQALISRTIEEKLFLTYCYAARRDFPRAMEEITSVYTTRELTAEETKWANMLYDLLKDSSSRDPNLYAIKLKLQSLGLKFAVILPTWLDNVKNYGLEARVTLSTFVVNSTGGVANNNDETSRQATSMFSDLFDIAAKELAANTHIAAKILHRQLPELVQKLNERYRWYLAGRQYKHYLDTLNSVREECRLPHDVELKVIDHLVCYADADLASIVASRRAYLLTGRYPEHPASVPVTVGEGRLRIQEFHANSLSFFDYADFKPHLTREQLTERSVTEPEGQLHQQFCALYQMMCDPDTKEEARARILLQRSPKEQNLLHDRILGLLIYAYFAEPEKLPKLNENEPKRDLRDAFCQELLSQAHDYLFRDHRDAIDRFVGQVETTKFARKELPAPQVGVVSPRNATYQVARQPIAPEPERFLTARGVGYNERPLAAFQKLVKELPAEATAPEVLFGTQETKSFDQREEVAFDQELLAGQKRAEGRIRYALADNFDKETALREAKNVRKGARTRLAQLETELLALANRTPSDPEDRLRSQLQFEGGWKKRLTIQDLKRLYFQRDFGNYHRLTYLDGAQIQELYRATCEYLILRGELVLDLQLVDLLRKVDQDPEAIQAIGELCASKRQFDPTSPDYRSHLILEEANEFLLRDNQVEFVDAFLEQKEGSYRNLAAKIPMGGGKTKVLLPLLALAKSNGKNLPFIVVPAAMYATNLQDMTNSSYALFGQKAETIRFDRDSPVTVETMDEILATFARVRKERSYLVVTPQVLQALQLKLFELLDLEPPRFDTDQVIERLGEILRQIKKDGHSIIDEAHLVLNARHELVFSAGTAQYLPAERIELLGQIYRTLCSQEKLGLRNNQQHLASEQLLKEVRQQVADEYYDDHAAEIPIPREEFVAYVCGKAKQVPDFIATSPLAGVIGLLKEELEVVLPLTLSKKGGEDYGLSQQDPTRAYSIPYTASRPNEKAEFGSPYESANHSYQHYIQKGVSTKQTEALIERFRARAERESLAENIPIGQASAAGQFETFAGRPLASMRTPRDTKQLRKALNEDPDKVIGLTSNDVVSSISYFNDRYVSNMVNFACMFASVQAITGTPYNAQSWWHGLTLVDTPGSDGEIAYTLLQRERTEPASTLTVCRAKRPAALIKELMQTRPDLMAKARGLADAGALFEGVPSSEVARELKGCFAGNPNVKGILYFDDTTNQLAILRTDSDTVEYLAGSDFGLVTARGYSRDELFTYFPQDRVTGSDIKMMIDARLLVTVSPKTPLHTLWQALLRARLQLTTQRGTLILQEDEAAHIEGPATLPNLLRNAVKVSARLKASDNYRSTLQNMSNLLREDLLNALLTLRSAAEMRQLHRQARPSQLLVQTSHDDPAHDFNQIRSLKKSKKLLTAAKDQYLKAYTDCVAIALERLAELNRLMQALIEQAVNEQRILNKMPSGDPTTQGTQMQRQISAEIAAERERKAELTLELDVTHYAAPAYASAELGKRLWYGIDITNYDFPDAYPDDFPRMFGNGFFDQFESLFDLNMRVSTNFLRTREHEEWITTKEKLPLHVLMIQKEGELAQFLLIGLFDFGEFTTKCKFPKQIGGPKIVAFSAVTGTPVLATGNVTADDTADMQKSPELRRALIQLWFFGGSVTILDRKELQPEIAAWLSTKERAKAAEALLLMRASKEEKALYAESTRLRKTIETIKAKG